MHHSHLPAKPQITLEPPSQTRSHAAHLQHHILGLHRRLPLQLVPKGEVQPLVEPGRDIIGLQRGPA